MKKLVIVFRLFMKIISWLATALIIYFTAAVVLSVLSTHPKKTNCIVEQKIYILSNGVHLDIAIPVELLGQTFIQQLEISSETQYVSFGWGDKDFYINTPEWSDLTFKTAFKALFQKSETAMHVTSYQNIYPHWKKIQLCPQQTEIITHYVRNSFIPDNNGKLKKLMLPGYNNNDSFYDARGSFSLFFTCNIWVNKALKEAEIKTSVWSPFDKGILFQINKNNKQNYDGL